MADKNKINARIVMKKDTSDNWDKATGFSPMDGEPIIVSDNKKKFKIGDGKTLAKDLPYLLDAIPVEEGEGEKSTVIGDGEASGKYTIASGTTDKTMITDLLGSLAAGVDVTAPKANADLSISIGSNNESNAVGSLTMGVSNITGASGYYWHDINITNKTITLSTTRRTSSSSSASAPSSIDWKVGDYISLMTNTNRYAICSKITAISGNTITVDSLPFSTDAYEYSKIPIIGTFIYKSPDDRTIFATHIENFDERDAGTLDSLSTTSKYTLRSGTVHMGFGASAIGAMNVGSGILSRATGYDNLAAGAFSTAEGMKNIAGYSAHAEGAKNKATGFASHAEGLFTYASDALAHAEGRETEAMGEGSHAEGYTTKTTGMYSHAEGSGISDIEQNKIKGTWTGSTNLTVGSLGDVENSLSYSVNFTVGDDLTTKYNTIRITGGGYDIFYGKTDNTEILAYNDCNWRISNIINFGNEYQDVGSDLQNILLQYWTPSSPLNYSGKKINASGYASHAEGSSIASADYAHAEGLYTVATKEAAHAEGRNTEAIGTRSHAEGGWTKASGDYAHSEGQETTASGKTSHAEGYKTIASGLYAHAEGATTTASGQSSHAEGTSTIATMNNAHAEGNTTQALHYNAHSEGQKTIAYANASHAEGESTTAYTRGAHSEGIRTKAGTQGDTENTFKLYEGAHAEGYETTASAKGAHAEGINTTASNEGSHAEGKQSVAYGQTSHAEGYKTKAGINDNTSSEEYESAHAEGYQTTASGKGAHAEGYNTVTGGTMSQNDLEAGNSLRGGSYAHAEGNATIARGQSSHSEGRKTFASGKAAHAEGVNTTASGEGSHAGGFAVTDAERHDDTSGRSGLIKASGKGAFIHGYTPYAEGVSVAFSTLPGDIIASGEGAIAMGMASIENGSGSGLLEASGDASFASGLNTKAKGTAAHAEGYETIAYGLGAHAEGEGTLAIGNASHAEGGEVPFQGLDYFFAGYLGRSGNTTFSGGLIDENLENITFANMDGENYKVLKIHVTGTECILTVEREYYNQGEEEVIWYKDGAWQLWEGFDIYSFEGTFISERLAEFFIENSLINTDVYPLYPASNVAYGNMSHVGGVKNIASGEKSFVHGVGLRTDEDNQVVFGYYNVPDRNASFIIGNGKEEARSNLFTIGTDFNGNYITLGNDKIYEGNFGGGSYHIATDETNKTFVANDLENNIASGNYAIAMGSASQATNTNSIAIGKNVVSSGEGSVAIGNTVSSQVLTSSGLGSVAMGASTQATASAATAFGAFSIASGGNSFAIGHTSKAKGNCAMALGKEITVSVNYQTAVGAYNAEDSVAKFVVGAGTSNTARANAFTTGKDSNGEYYITVGSTKITEA